MNVPEIEAAIAELPSADMAKLVDWLQSHHAKVWDQQIEEDLEAGRLDDLLTEVDNEYAAGLASPL